MPQPDKTALKFQNIMLKAVAKYGSTVHVLRREYKNASGVYIGNYAFTLRGFDVKKREAYPAYYAAQGIDNEGAGQSAGHNILYLAGDALSEVREGDTFYFKGWLFTCAFADQFSVYDHIIIREVFYIRDHRPTQADLDDFGVTL